MKSWQIVVKVSNEKEPGKGFTLSLDRTPVTIGARPENDVVLADPWVSGAHAHVVLSHGGLVAHDHSRNGSFVSGQKIQSAPIRPGDSLSIPPFSLSFELISGEEERMTRVFEVPALDPPVPSTSTFASPPLVPVPASAAPASALPPATPVAAPHPIGLSLEVRDGPPAVPRRRLPLPPRPFSIGRDAEADLMLDLPTISRLHAEIRPDAEGWIVRDLGSSNGTSVNGRRVAEAPLRPGDELHLPGGVVIALVLGAAAPPAVQPPPLPRPAVPAAPRTHPPAPAMDPAPSPPLPGGAASARALHVSQRRAGPGAEVLVLELAGRVDGYNYTELGQVLDGVVDRNEALVAIDLSQVDFMDHTGLGVLVKTASALEETGGQLRLCGLSPRLADSFSLSRLDVFFRGKIARDTRAAVQDLLQR